MTRKDYEDLNDVVESLRAGLDAVMVILDRSIKRSDEVICKDCHSFTGGRSNKGFCNIKRADVKSFQDACPYFTEEKDEA